MIIQRFKDGSEDYQYENGDLVIFIEDDHYSSCLGYKAGDWGRIYLTDPKDRARGHTTSVSHPRVALAGVSTPKDSFIQSQAGPAWDLYPALETYKAATIEVVS